LFVQGGVFQRGVLEPPQPAVGGNNSVKVLPPTISHNMKAEGVDGEFLTSIVRKQLHQECVFNVGGEPVLMWGDLTRAEEVELATRIENVGKVAIGRLRADFPKSEMRFFLRALHMPLCVVAFGPGGMESKQVALTNNCQQALKHMGFKDEAMPRARLDYKDLATLFARLIQPGGPLATMSDREIWGHCLDFDFLNLHFPGKPFVVMKALVRFFISIEDGSCNVERGLAGIRALISEHNTKCIETLDDLAVLCSTELLPEDDAVKKGGVWEAGVFGLECGALWRAVLGARMGIHGNPEAGKKKLQMRRGTFKHVKAGVLKAIGAATRSTAPRPLANGVPMSLATALGVGDGDSKAGTPRCPYWHKGFLITPQG